MIGKFNRKVFWIILLIIVIDNLVKEVLLWLNLIRENEDNPIEIQLSIRNIMSNFINDLKRLLPKQRFKLFGDNYCLFMIIASM